MAQHEFTPRDPQGASSEKRNSGPILQSAARLNCRACALTPKGMAWLELVRRLEAMHAEIITEGNQELASLLADLMNDHLVKS